MKKRLLIVGGGFAGFWSAVSAIRQSREIQKRDEVEITLVNPDNHVTMRPKLNELFLDGLRFEMDKYLKPLGVNQILGRIEKVNAEKSEVSLSTTQGNKEVNYDYLILAAGASLKVPGLPGIKHTFSVDSLHNMQRLEDHISRLANNGFLEEGASTFVVVGSGFSGLETVIGIEQKAQTIQSYYPGKKRDFRVVLLERADQVASQFPNDCRKYLLDMIASKNIEIIVNSEITIVGPASVLLNEGALISTRTVIWTEGIVASFLTQFFKGAKDNFNRVTVDRFLKLQGYDNVIAAGNVAHTSGDIEHTSFADCQYAQFEGRWAGHNAINDLFNIPLKEYVSPGYLNCVDVGEPQTLYPNEWERKMQERKYKERAAEKHINTVTMYPWQDVEETVRASFPEIPRFRI